MSDIVIGEPLAWDIFTEGNKLLLRRGQVVQTAAQVQALVQRGLYIDEELSDAAAARARQEAMARQVERPSALRFINLAARRLEKLLYNLSNEPEIEPKVREVAKALVFASDVSSDVAIGSILLNQRAANYAVRHSIDTALLVLDIARAMNKTSEDIDHLMTAALTMNVSILRQQDQWQARQEPLPPKDQELIQCHATESARMLREAGVGDVEWLRYVELHHVECDPATGGDVPQNVKILRFADAYCASIADRKYRKPLLPATALRDVLIADGKPRDPLVAAYFIKELGQYPPGTWVRLQSGEVGVVTRRGKTPTTPVVHALIGPRGAPLSFPIQRDTSKDLYALREALPAESNALRFSLQQLWGDDAAL
ncbi:metal-dependent phosphohydrolase [Oxalobacteraceae bacterium OM1]|nr:metal-dependent phosphohydrolase [Oxalobacteraceae bacterium OM1]